MKKSNKIPDSDQTARKRQEDESERIPAAADLYSGGNNPDTSNKSGKHSTVRKLAASRPEFGSSAGAKHVDGATGKQAESREPHAVPRAKTKGKRG